MVDEDVKFGHCHGHGSLCNELNHMIRNTLANPPIKHVLVAFDFLLFEYHAQPLRWIIKMRRTLV